MNLAHGCSIGYFCRVDLTASGLIGFFIDCDPVRTDLACQHYAKPYPFPNLICQQMGGSVTGIAIPEMMSLLTLSAPAGFAWWNVEII
jgi:hypothetical protein